MAQWLKKLAKTAAEKKNGNGAMLGFEQTLWAAADKLRIIWMRQSINMSFSA